MGATDGGPGRLDPMTETLADGPAPRDQGPEDHGADHRASDAPPPDAPVATSSADPVPAPAMPTAFAKWAWRLGSIAVLLVAAGLLVYATSRAEVTEPGDTGDMIVRKLTPGDGAKALRQTEVGANLQDGFDGRLTVNDTPIPEDQMEGVVDPSSPEAARLSPDQPARPRPNNRNRVFFLPGPGKVIEKLPQGENTITVTYFKDSAPNQGRGSLTWSIDVD